MFEPLKNLEALQAHELALDLDDVVRSTQAPRHCFFGNPTYPSGEYVVAFTYKGNVFLEDSSDIVLVGKDTTANRLAAANNILALMDDWHNLLSYTHEHDHAHTHDCDCTEDGCSHDQGCDCTAEHGACEPHEHA